MGHIVCDLYDTRLTTANIGAGTGKVILNGVLAK